MRRRDFLAGGLAAAVTGPSAFAQGAYPNKPIRVVVPTSAGGVHDVITRIWADRLKSSLGTIIIENRAGGGSSIALNYVAQSPADGYLLLNGSTSTLSCARAAATARTMRSRTSYRPRSSPRPPRRSPSIRRSR